MKQNTWLIMLVFLLIVILFVKYVFVYFAPFLIGILIATIIHPMIDFLEVNGCPRAYSSFVFVVIAFGSMLLLIGFAVVGLWNETEQLITVIQQLYASTDQWLERMLLFFHGLSTPILEIIPVIHHSLSQIIIGLLIEFLELIKHVPSAMVFWFLAAFTTFFVSRDKLLIMNFLGTIMPKSWHRKLFGFKREMIHGLMAYLKAQVILMFISTCLTVTGFLLLKQPYAWVLGLIVGIFELLPMIGPSGVFIPVIVYNLFTDHFIRSMGIGIIWLTTLLIRQAWEPQIVGNQLGLHPLTILVAMYLGVSLLGASGFLLGPLLMIICKAFYIVIEN